MNIERLRKVVEVIAANPQAFDMEVWHCGTEACFAGHAVDVMAREQGLSVTAEEVETALPWTTSCCRLNNGPARSWSEVAREYFGLNADQAEALFDPANWPETHTNAYYDAVENDDRQGRVVALQACVEDFIASGGDVAAFAKPDPDDWEW